MASNNIKKEMALEFARDKRTHNQPRLTKPLTPEMQASTDRVRAALTEAMKNRKRIVLPRSR